MAVSTGQYSAFLPDPSSSFHSLKRGLKNISAEVKTKCSSFFPITFKINLPSHHRFEKLHINLKKKKKCGSHCDNGLGASTLLLTLFMQSFYCQDMSSILVHYWNIKLSHFLWRTIQHHVVQQNTKAHYLVPNPDFCHLLVLWPWTSQLTFLCLSLKSRKKQYLLFKVIIKIKWVNICKVLRSLIFSKYTIKVIIVIIYQNYKCIEQSPLIWGFTFCVVSTRD